MILDVHPESRLFPLPDPGAKKAPYPGSETLVRSGLGIRMAGPRYRSGSGKMMILIHKTILGQVRTQNVSEMLKSLFLDYIL
jgi:hypothetical protein